MNTQTIDRLTTNIMSLIQSGKRDDSNTTTAGKTEGLLMAKAIRVDVKAAGVEASQLTDDQRDELSLKLGAELFRVLGGA